MHLDASIDYGPVGSSESVMAYFFIISWPLEDLPHIVQLRG